MALECEITKSFQNEIKKLIKAYEETGIVTRNDVKTMESYSGSKRLHKALLECDYNESILIEVFSSKHLDYSNIIFNSEKYSVKEAKEYIFK